MPSPQRLALACLIACLIAASPGLCWRAGQATPAVGPVDGVRSSHDGRVIYDLLAALRASAQAQQLSRLGFAEFASSFQGDTRALVLKGTNRIGLINESIATEILRSMAGTRHFSLQFTLKQARETAGTLVAFTAAGGRSSVGDRVLEVLTTWPREELRLRYTARQTIGGAHTESLPYHLADDSWHQVALGVSDGRVSLTVDCRKIYDRLMMRQIMGEAIFRPRGTALWLGQRARWQSYFQGEIQDAKLVIGEHSQLEQCPLLEFSLPSCVQQDALSRTVESLQSEVLRLQNQLKSTQTELQRLSHCDCLQRCPYNGTQYEEGQSWDIEGCQRCVCRKGRITCGTRPCPPLPCAHPVLPATKNACCPTCLRSCELPAGAGSASGPAELEHGANITSLAEIGHDGNRHCVTCHCRDGTIECQEPADYLSLCPVADCPLSRQKVNSFDCCPYCEGYDFCARGHSCSAQADCVNLHNRFHCVCRPGYYGNGRECVDVDECATPTTAGGSPLHRCGNFSSCVNTPGSYVCNCKPGFVRVNQFECEDVDECSNIGAGTIRSISQQQPQPRRCSPQAHCANTLGSFECRCRPGYQGDGVTCRPVCLPECKNGGRCVRPGVCACPAGFHGNRCEKDLDECALGLHRCRRNSRCRNLPGSYYCACNPGFTDAGRDNAFGGLCWDVNECLGRRGTSHTCPRGTRCVNTPGGYKCLCKRGPGQCNGGCALRTGGRRMQNIDDGVTIRDPIDLCANCTCQAGFLNCTKLSCSDCFKLRNPEDLHCCPECLPNGTATCLDSLDGSTHEAGSSWTRDCDICTCQSAQVQCQAIKCPAVACSNPTTRAGGCCPTCEAADPCRETAPEPEAPAAGRWYTGPRSSCSYGGQWMKHGSRWRLGGVSCVLCHCRDGHNCCSHDDSCDRANAPVADPARPALRSVALHP